MANRKQEDELQQKKEELFQDLHHAIGAYCELRSPDHILTCVGRIHALNGEALTVVAEDNGEMPVVIFNTEFKLIIRPKKRPPMVLSAMVCGSSRALWKLDRITRFQYKENRAYFRQPVSAKAYVACVNGLYHPEKGPGDAGAVDASPCQVADISLEGVQIRSVERYGRGDWLFLTDLALIDGEQRSYTFICQVCWADRASKDEFLFGCRFIPLSEQEQDWLCSDIFTLQRQDIKLRRR